MSTDAAVLQGEFLELIARAAATLTEREREQLVCVLRDKIELIAPPERNDTWTDTGYRR